MKVLPDQITSAILQGFWIVFITVSVTLISVAAWILTASALFLLLLLSIPLLIYPVILNPDSVVKFYILFNRVLKKINRDIRYLILLIIHYLFLLPLRFTGSRDPLNLKPPVEGSTWTVKSPDDFSGESEGHGIYADTSARSGWLRTFVSRVVHEKKWWLLTAVPFMLIISFLSERKEEKKISSYTYTLY